MKSIKVDDDLVVQIDDFAETIRKKTGAKKIFRSVVVRMLIKEGLTVMNRKMNGESLLFIKQGKRKRKLRVKA